MLRILQRENGSASEIDQRALARWSGWGALPAMFDPGAEALGWARAELATLLNTEELAAAARSAINAHYTDASYSAAIWKSVERLGFVQGRVLEPGCGSGNFLAFAPQAAQVVGVELDPTTAAIASALHPHAQVHAESFADSRFGDGTFDLVIGNVPFGDITLHDRRHNGSGHRIHNHFIIKGLHLTKPGGLVAVITSRYTLDSTNPAARREMAALADLIGAVRLPTGAHRRAAGTDVVTDLLLFRRREPGAEQQGPAFEITSPLGETPELASLRINEYFTAHPQHVLGTLGVTQADRGRLELDVAGDRAAESALTAALDTIVTAALERGFVYEALPTLEPEPVAVVSRAVHKPDGYIADHGSGFTRIEKGQETPHTPPASQRAELRALVGLRDTVVTLIEAEAASSVDGPIIAAKRARLNAEYDAYVATYGAINRFGLRATGRVDESGQPKMARIRPRQGGFRADPFANVVLALEHFDSSTQTAAKAAIFHERVIARRVERLGADTTEDALAICVDMFGEVRLEHIARLLGVDAEQARRQLATLVFDEPETDRLVPAAEYLSGNVREKLARAQDALTRDARYAPNVTALTEVVPRDLAPDEIVGQLGAAWIDHKYVQQFLSEILEDPTLRVEHPAGALWIVHTRRLATVQATSQWGTEARPAPELAQALLEQRPIRVYYEGPAGESIFNAEATDAAVEKANELAERFSEWLWEDPERATLLARTYNDRFNAIVPRSYDGAKLSLPGLALTFKPRPHQLAAVARIINEPSVGLFHDMGAGKTSEIVMGAMELKRLGLVTKPGVVVPNHMLDQFSREWLQRYPQARILAASQEDLERDKRRLFQAKCATGDWDAVVMTRSAFERIPMSPAAERAYLEREITMLDDVLQRTRAASANLSVKRLEKIKLRAEQRIKSQLDGAKDPGVTFEMLGIDYIFADEAHAYKNLRTSSNIEGMAVEGSMRASDLHMKVEFLRAKRGRVVTLATGTPLANSMVEAYTMQRYLRPDLLEQAGIGDFDQWAATFGKMVTAIEVSPDGSGMRMQTRFASFRNVPELLQLWRVSADIKTAEDLQLPVPLLVQRADGQRAPEIVVIEPSTELSWYVKELAERADQVRARRVDPRVDNLLKIASDGRAAGLDLRLIRSETTAVQKVDVAAERIATIYETHREDTFVGADGRPHPRPGALQLVFSDLGTPKAGAWNIYDGLRDLLIGKGVPAKAVRFIHEAKDDQEKAELFEACRDGRVAVLIGSTERMGVGTNVQLRAVALHHLDCPWRPADIAQREGRIVRQGNANAEVAILRYVTEGSFDGYLWQTVSRKAQFIAQVMRGKLDVREIEDIGDAALSYNEVKALAAGNPLLIDQARVHAEVSRLERLQRAHVHKQGTLQYTIRRNEHELVRTQSDVAAFGRAMEQYAREQASDTFNMTVANHVCRKPSEGNALLRDALARFAAECDRDQSERVVVLGSLHGFEVRAQRGWLRGEVQLNLGGVPGSATTFERKGLESSLPVTRLENRLADLPTSRRAAELDLGRLELELRRAREELTRPFRFADQLVTSRAQLRAIDEQLHAEVVPARADSASHVPAPQQTCDATSRAVMAAQPSPEERWTAALTQELKDVRERAEALRRSLQGRTRRLVQRQEAHMASEPTRPGLLALPAARAKYVEDTYIWSKREQALHRRSHQLTALYARLDEYTKDVLQLRATMLARRNISRREPELARAVQEQRMEALRQDREPRSRGRRSR